MSSAWPWLSPESLFGAPRPLYWPPRSLTTRGRAPMTRINVGQNHATETPASPAMLIECTVRARETVGWARELLGGNGILLDHHVARFVADAEAIYSYEGTREINALVVGRAITGHSAFV